MPGARKKVKRFVLDVNCFVSIFINGEATWLFDYVIRNRLEIFIDRNLLSELANVLEYPKIKKRLPLRPTVYLDFVREISIEIISAPHNVQSPDEADDYLYDIASSSNAKIFVTKEKALLRWEHSPVRTISLENFKSLFS